MNEAADRDKITKKYDYTLQFILLSVGFSFFEQWFCFTDSNLTVCIHLLTLINSKQQWSVQKTNKKNTLLHAQVQTADTQNFPQAIFFFSGAFGDQMWGRWDYLSFIFQVFRNRTLNWWSVVNVNCSVKCFGCYYVSAESLLCPWNPYSEPLIMRLILRFFSVKVCTEVSL